MRHTIKRFSVLAMLLGLCTSIYAEYFEVDGIRYYTTSSSTVEVIEKGTDKYSGDIVIPESVDVNGTTYSVTSIGYGAFSGCINLTSITIPNSIASISDSAFLRCSGLTSITIPNSVTVIDGYAFYGCSSLTSITIPNTVTSIGRRAFEGCSSLTSVTIGNNVTSIGVGAFEDCNSIEKVILLKFPTLRKSQ